jgi:hypothetical protein
MCHPSGRCFKRPLIPNRTSEDVAQALKEVEALVANRSSETQPFTE